MEIIESGIGDKHTRSATLIVYGISWTFCRLSTESIYLPSFAFKMRFTTGTSLSNAHSANDIYSMVLFSVGLDSRSDRMQPDAALSNIANGEDFSFYLRLCVEMFYSLQTSVWPRLVNLWKYCSLLSFYLFCFCLCILFKNLFL